MHCQNPYKISMVNPNQIFFKNIKESKNKKIIFIKYKDDNVLKNMVFQLPTLVNNIRTENNEVEISLECVEEFKTPKIIDLINLIDEKIVNEAKKNANIWFDHINDKTKINFHHSLRESNDSLMLKLKIIDSKEFKTNIILNNNESEKILFNEIPTTGKLKVVLECYAVWIHGDTFGLILRPVILSFIMDIETEYNYKILDDSESDISDDENNDMLFIKNTEVNNEQSTIENEQSTIENEQSTIENKQSTIENKQFILNNKQSEWDNEQSKLKLQFINSSISESSSESNDHNLSKIIFNVSKI